MTLLVNRFANELKPKLHNNIPGNPSFCSFASFLIVLLTSFINILDSSNYLSIFMMLLIFSFEIINVVTPDSNIFLWIAGSVADAAPVNPNCIKTVLANGLRTSPIKGNPDFSNPPKSLPKNRVLCYAIEFLNNLILVD